MEGWAAAGAAFFQTVKKVLDRLWGEQTAQAASLQRRAEEAVRHIQLAKADMRRAQSEGETEAYRDAATRLNRWSSELKRVSDEAAAKRP